MEGVEKDGNWPHTVEVPALPASTPALLPSLAYPMVPDFFLTQGDFSLRILFVLLTVWLLSDDPGHQIHA